MTEALKTEKKLKDKTSVVVGKGTQYHQMRERNRERGDLEMERKPWEISKYDGR